MGNSEAHPTPIVACAEAYVGDVQIMKVLSASIVSRVGPGSCLLNSKGQIMARLYTGSVIKAGMYGVAQFWNGPVLTRTGGRPSKEGNDSR
ncbi:hypothetical protein PIIN_06014 [Serendipita indica DSM 11827]|uniref:Uncharacterized protein n=1 Tax=Serendipita indica (strain DSM 11827) TaxID=1109443 RepID=G4TL85_SERID|nr:hypothetical protein PIIN_06014 [Serendipita indica DSM 11827]